MKLKRLMTDDEIEEFLKLRYQNKNKDAAKYVASLDLFEKPEEKKSSNKKK